MPKAPRKPPDEPEKADEPEKDEPTQNEPIEEPAQSELDRSGEGEDKPLPPSEPTLLLPMIAEIRPPSNIPYPQVTLGIARNMQVDVAEPANVPEPTSTGGGNLNGSANIANLLGQSGTNATQLQMPRANIRAGGGNYCGIV